MSVQAGNDEPLFCSAQIVIPPALPDIIKQFTKAAIRAKPTDLVQWSAEYFSNLANGKETEGGSAEDAPRSSSRIASRAGFSEANMAQFYSKCHQKSGGAASMAAAGIRDIADSAGIPKETLNDVFSLGAFNGSEEVAWMHIFAMCCTQLAGDLRGSMVMSCKAIDHEKGISFDLFKEIYSFLVSTDGDISTATRDKVLSHLQSKAEKQGGQVMAADIESSDCPPLSV